MSDAPNPQLDDNTTDWIASIVKGVVGAVPIVDSLIAEVIGSIIPNQRVDRIAEFVRLLNERLSHVEQELLSKRFREPGTVDLFEDAFIQAARATTL